VEGSGVPPFRHLPAHGTGEARHLALLHGRGLVPQGTEKNLSKTAGPLGYLQKAKGSWSDFSKEFLDLLLVAHFPGSQQTGFAALLQLLTHARCIHFGAPR